MRTRRWLFPKENPMEICEKSGSTILLLEKITSWYGKYPIIYQGFMHVRIYTYPIIYQGFIHNISHYVPGVLYISQTGGCSKKGFLLQVKPMDAVDPNPPFPSRGVAGLPGNEESFDENNRWNTKHQNTNSRLFFCKEKLVVDFLGIFLIFLYVIFFNLSQDQCCRQNAPWLWTWSTRWVFFFPLVSSLTFSHHHRLTIGLKSPKHHCNWSHW